MKLCLRILPLLFLVSCATKYILPGNRFITPETQGGLFESQFEVQQTSATRLNIDGSSGSLDDGVIYNKSKRTGYLFSTSLLDMVDFYWSHAGSANSMLGAKVQLLGGSRLSKSAGHKFALSAAFGGNEHELSGDPKIKFKLAGNDVALIHGYRFNEFFMIYDSLSYSRYKFDGKVSSSNPTFNGGRPGYATKLYGAHLGTELSFGPLFGKLEYGYQMIDTNSTKKRMASVFGYSVGFSW